MAHAAEVLLIEDNPADQRLILYALKDSQWIKKPHLVSDGEAAIDFLYRKGVYQNVPRPDLIILDLNLPRKDGREVLAQIKQDPNLKQIPVIVFTSSMARNEVSRSYQLGANSYLIKKAELEEYLASIRSIEQYWLSLSEIPNGEN